jgi:hypothetical protein
LTYDQKKAAEAAFRGDPFNPRWSTAALVVYEGIRAAMATRFTDASERNALVAPYIP